MNEHIYNTVLNNLHRWESFSQENQEEVIIHLEALLMAFEDEQNRTEYEKKPEMASSHDIGLHQVAEALLTIMPPPSALNTQKYWKDPAGAWSDLPETLLEDLEALRHSNPQ